MDENLVGVLQGMTLEDEDVPIVLPDDEDYSTVERSSRSLLGRLLNPACQNMARMIRTMPKVWRVYERARGIALTKESFQFIFELESDLQMVLKFGFWTFEDWGLALERWVESPPSNYLQTAPIWLRISNIPVNYLTVKTIDSVAGAIGYVKDIEWDPEKPLLNNYIRVRVVMDLNLPVRDKKCLTLPKGAGSVMIDVEYERIRKKCYHCFRLSHEKQACPLLKNTQPGIGKGRQQQHSPSLQRLSQRQHNNSLAQDIMPLLAPTIPPGFSAPSGLIAPEVFEQMQLYMNCLDPEERRIREFRMKKALDELSKDSIAQRAGLRMEDAPRVLKQCNKDKGLVFDYREVGRAETENVEESASFSENTQRKTAKRNCLAITDGQERRTVSDTVFDRGQMAGGIKAAQDNTPKLDGGQEGGDDARFQPDLLQQSGFDIGSNSPNVAVKGGTLKGSRRNVSTWSRRVKRSPLPTGNQGDNSVEDSQLKRKAIEDVEVTSKISKSTTGLMVHQKPSSPQ